MCLDLAMCGSRRCFVGREASAGQLSCSVAAGAVSWLAAGGFGEAQREKCHGPKSRLARRWTFPGPHVKGNNKQSPCVFGTASPGVRYETIGWGSTRSKAVAPAFGRANKCLLQFALLELRYVSGVQCYIVLKKGRGKDLWRR